MLRQRLTLGPILILGIIVGLWLDEWIDHLRIPEGMRGLFGGGETFPPGILVMAVCATLAWAGARELVQILADNGIHASKRITVVASLAGLAVASLTPSTWRAEATVALVSMTAAVILVVSMSFYSRRRSVEGVVAAAGGTLLGFVYLGLMFGLVVVIRREHPAWVLAWVLVITKACDVGAFFTGRAIGRHKLIPWLSPGKTWEGLAGGMVTSGLVGLLGLWALGAAGLDMPLSPLAAAFGGMALGAVGQAGDLMESVLKRDAGVKDSGSGLPGFGGVLDVMDSVLLAAPVAYWLLRTSTG